MALISESLYTELGSSMATLSRTVLRRLISTPHTPTTSISATQLSQPLPPYAEYDDPPPRYVPPPPYTQRQGWRRVE
ncbi:hypothetical protein SpCBS45565_g05953 [Spizellomyces sp. 'palustris']|nr:hypothetical protein SpCBS45565_g05953 [Spizellomyces sp. 'palustris']